MGQTERGSRLRALDLITYWAPPLAIALLCLTYFLWPDFYLRFVIEQNVREYQTVELLTLALAVSGTAILVRSTISLWKLQ